MKLVPLDGLHLDPEFQELLDESKISKSTDLTVLVLPEGETILGYIISETDSEFFTLFPSRFILAGNRESGLEPRIVPYVSSTAVRFFKSHIFFSFPAHSEYEMYYSQYLLRMIPHCAEGYISKEAMVELEMRYDMAEYLLSSEGSVILPQSSIVRPNSDDSENYVMSEQDEAEEQYLGEKESEIEPGGYPIMLPEKKKLH